MNSAEVHCLILLLQVPDSANSGYLSLFPVQNKLVLKMRLYETEGRVEIKSLWKFFYLLRILICGSSANFQGKGILIGPPWIPESCACWSNPYGLSLLDPAESLR